MRLFFDSVISLHPVSARCSKTTYCTSRGLHPDYCPAGSKHLGVIQATALSCTSWNVGSGVAAQWWVGQIVHKPCVVTRSWELHWLTRVLSCFIPSISSMFFIQFEIFGEHSREQTETVLSSVEFFMQSRLQCLSSGDRRFLSVALNNQIFMSNWSYPNRSRFLWLWWHFNSNKYIWPRCQQLLVPPGVGATAKFIKLRDVCISCFSGDNVFFEDVLSEGEREYCVVSSWQKWWD